MRGEHREHHRPKTGEPGARQGEGKPLDSGPGPLPPAGEAPTAQIPATSVPMRARPARVIALALAGLVLAAGAVVAFLAIRQANERAAAERHRAEVRAEREAAARRKAIARRRQLVRNLELSVAKKAAIDVAPGVMVGPIRRTVCTPLGATTPNDLTQHTASFECIAVTKDNPDGSYEGYRYRASVNYDSGRYTSRLAG